MTLHNLQQLAQISVETARLADRLHTLCNLVDREVDALAQGLPIERYHPLFTSEAAGLCCSPAPGPSGSRTLHASEAPSGSADT